jgi:hypothetical protein
MMAPSDFKPKHSSKPARGLALAQAFEVGD